MTDTAQSTLQQQLHGLAKVDLHRHLEGSLRLATLVDVAVAYDLDFPHTLEGLRPFVQVVEPWGDYVNFLSKFGNLRQFYQSPEIVDRFAYEAIADAAADNVRYLELRFTPKALAVARDFPLEDATDWVIAAVRRAEAEHDIKVALIVSLNRHEPLDLAERMTRIAIDRLDQGILALDLAGNEAEFMPDPFEGLFAEAAQAGLRPIAHAGEWNGAHIVRHAIERFNVTRIGHGVRVVEDPAVVELARERGICFEVCLTTNLHSGVVPQLETHPITQMIEAGLRCTLNTDDPSVSGITLSDDYAAAWSLGIDLDTLNAMMLNAVDAALLDDTRRADLRARFVNGQSAASSASTGG